MPNVAQQKVLVGLSGGMGSAITAALLKNQGYDVVALHVSLKTKGVSKFDHLGFKCLTLSDATRARKFCERLDVPFHEIDGSDHFEHQVIDNLVHEYLSCRYPNPCIKCHTGLKLRLLFEKADELDCPLIATGHYTQIHHEVSTGLARVYKAIDSKKDQSYLLFELVQEQLKRLLMPMGNLQTTMVRRLAVELGMDPELHTENAQTHCFNHHPGRGQFIDSRSTKEFREPGSIKITDGTTVGHHMGLHRHEIGQHQGLHLTVKDTEKYYVIDKRKVDNVLVVGYKEQLYTDELVVESTNWLRTMNSIHDIHCSALLDPERSTVPCVVAHYAFGYATVRFEEGQRAINPGQPILFYDDTELLGGAYVRKTIPHDDQAEAKDKKGAY